MIKEQTVEAAESALSIVYNTWRDCAIGVVAAVEPVILADLQSKIRGLHASSVDEFSLGWEAAINEMLTLIARDSSVTV